jgi:hypothetical protein
MKKQQKDKIGQVLPLAEQVHDLSTIMLERLSANEVLAEFPHEESLAIALKEKAKALLDALEEATR